MDGQVTRYKQAGKNIKSIYDPSKTGLPNNHPLLKFVIIIMLIQKTTMKVIDQNQGRKRWSAVRTGPEEEE